MVEPQGSVTEWEVGGRTQAHEPGEAALPVDRDDQGEVLKLTTRRWRRSCWRTWHLGR